MTSQDDAGTGPGPARDALKREPRTSTLGAQRQVWTWTLVLFLALAAGVAAWRLGEGTMEFAKLSQAAAENYRDSTALNMEMPRVASINGALTLGVLGALLGLALGLAGGLCRRSMAAAITGAVVGLILGTAAGALPAWTVMPWHWRHRNDDPATLDLLAPLLMHMALWSTIGLAAGLAFGIGSSGARPLRLLEAALAGLAGAMLGTFLFEVTGAMLFPMDHTADPFSTTSATRLLARLCLAGGVGLGVIRSLPSLQKTDEASPQASPQGPGSPVLGQSSLAKGLPGSVQ